MPKSLKIALVVMGILFVGIPFLIFVFGMFFIDSVKAKNTFKEKVAALKNYAGMSYKEGDDTPIIKLPLYKMLEEYTFYGYSERLNYSKKFNKDEIFYGVVKQFDVSHGSDKSLNLIFPMVIKDFIEMTGQELPTGIPLSKCRLLTKEETDAHYGKIQASI